MDGASCDLCADARLLCIPRPAIPPIDFLAPPVSPQVVFHTHREGMFRGIEQKHTALTIITGSTWTNVFENDMQNLIRMVWQGGDRQ